MEKGVPWNYDPSHTPSKKPHSPSFAPSNTATPTIYSKPTGAPWFGTEMNNKDRIDEIDSKKEEEMTVMTTTNNDADADGGGSQQLFGHSGNAQPTQPQQQPQPQPQSTKDNTRTDQDQGKGTTYGQETTSQRAYFESMMALKNSLVPQSTLETHIQRDKKMDHDKMAPWNEPDLPSSSPTGMRETGIPSSSPWFNTQSKTTKDDRDTEDYDKGSVKGTKENSSKQEKQETKSLQNSKETLIILEKKLQTLQKTLKGNQKKLRGS